MGCPIREEVIKKAGENLTELLSNFNSKDSAKEQIDYLQSVLLAIDVYSRTRKELI